MKPLTGPQSDGRIDVGKYNPSEVTIIGIDTDDTAHPLLDRASNVSTITEGDIRFAVKRGVMIPVKCKRDGDRLIVIDGRGRTRKLRLANERIIAEGGTPWRLPVEIVRGDEIKMLSLKVASNHHRRTLDPIARAVDAAELVEKIGNEDAAIEFGVTTQQLKNILALNDLAPVAAKAVSKGTISATAAVQLAGLSEADQGTKLTELLESGEKPTVERAKIKAREAAGKEVTVTPKGKLILIMTVLDKLDGTETKEDLLKALAKIRKAAEK